MSATLATTLRPVQTRKSASLRIFNACWERITRYLIHRAAIAAVRELDDRILEDIGLERSQIEAAVRGLVTAPNRAWK
jgi:uncharacterized protein YjiS (DUF1127 family)